MNFEKTTDGAIVFQCGKKHTSGLFPFHHRETIKSNQIKIL